MHRQTWERQTNKQKQCSGEQSQPWGLQASTGPNSPPWLFIDEPSFITVDAFEARPQDLRLTEGPVTPNTHMHRCTHTQGFFTDTRTHKASLIPDRKRKRETKSLVYRVFLPFLSFFFHFQLFFIQWEKNCTIAHKPVTLRTEDNLYYIYIQATLSILFSISKTECDLPGRTADLQNDFTNLAVF